jgi:SAM-dependent methyltransferase
MSPMPPDIISLLFLKAERRQRVSASRWNRDVRKRKRGLLAVRRRQRLKACLRRGKQPRLSVEICQAGAPPRINCEFGDIFRLGVSVKNTGESVLDSRRHGNPDYLSYHWEAPDGRILDYDGLRNPFLGPVVPGSQVSSRMRVSVTPRAERAVLAVDVVREGVTWFSQLGGGTLKIPFEIAVGADVERLEERLKDGGGAGSRAPTVQEFWGARAGARHSGEEWGWLDHPAVLEECVFPKLGGRARNWLMLMLERHGIDRGGDWLSLGCGDGGFELWLLDEGVAGSITGVDVSPAAISIARGEASRRGAERAGFAVADLNRERIPGGPYDVIFTSMSLHHLSELERALSGIRDSLRDGGFFLANEYVGPSRFQFPLEQKEIADSLIAALPKEMRFHSVASRQAGEVVFKDRYLSRTMKQWEEVDPSEAVRSDEIVGLIENTFARSWVYPYGGSLLHLVLEHIATNFDPGNQAHRALIKLLDSCESGTQV